MDSYLYSNAFPWIRTRRTRLFKCDMCNLDFIFQKDMLDHFSNNHRSNICYACSFCSKTFEASDLLIGHFQADHISDIHLCIKCDFHSKNEEDLLRHASIHATENQESSDSSLNSNGRTAVQLKSLACTLCPRIYTQPSLLRQHMTFHSDNNGIVQNGDDTHHHSGKSSCYFLCIFCLKRFKNRCLLEVHERLHRGEVDPDGRIRPEPGIPLVLVQQEKTTAGRVLVELRSVPREDCVGGEVTAARPDPLTVDLGCRGEAKPGASSSSSYVCHCCPKSFRSKVKFLDHFFEHDKSVKSFSCLACEARFGYSSSVPKHVSMHLRDLGLAGPAGSPDLCPRCGKCYRDAASLKRHERMVHAGVGYRCQGCGKSFSSAQSLEQHLRQHSGELAYACDVCPRRYANPSSLHNHKKIHSEVKLSCDVCHRTFSLKHHLNRHRARHAGSAQRGRK